MLWYSNFLFRNISECSFQNIKKKPNKKIAILIFFLSGKIRYDENHFYYNSSGEYQKDPPKTKSPPKFPYLPNDHEDVDYEEEDIDYGTTGNHPKKLIN